jgi:hypothetical protein
MSRLQRILAGFGIGATVWAAGMTVGYAVAYTQANTRLEAASVVAASLRDSLVIARAEVRVDSVRVDSVVTRWRLARARVDTMTDTVRLVDTLKVLVTDAEEALDICTASFNGCANALALAERQAAADSTTRVRLGGLVNIATARAERAEAQSWRHRVEGAVVTGLAVIALNQLGRK